MANKRYDINPTDTKVVTFTPVLDTSIYANGDVLFIPIEVTGVFDRLGGVATLQSVVVSDGDDQNVSFDLIFSNATMTLGTLNNAVSISDTDAAKILGHVSLVPATHATDLINSILFSKTACNLVMQADSASTSLWVSGIVRSGTPTFSAAGMKIKLGFL